MTRYILTGAPGAGKTALLRLLERRGYAVVEEAATDVIALEQARGREEPWTDPGFIDLIIALQKQRQTGVGSGFFDRSPVCTLALSAFLAFRPRRPCGPRSPGSRPSTPMSAGCSSSRTWASSRPRRRGASATRTRCGSSRSISRPTVAWAMTWSSSRRVSWKPAPIRSWRTRPSSSRAWPPPPDAGLGSASRRGRRLRGADGGWRSSPRSPW